MNVGVLDLGVILTIVNMTILGLVILGINIWLSKPRPPEPLPDTSFCWYPLETKQQ